MFRSFAEKFLSFAEKFNRIYYGAGTVIGIVLVIFYFAYAKSEEKLARYDYEFRSAAIAVLDVAADSESLIVRIESDWADAIETCSGYFWNCKGSDWQEHLQIVMGEYEAEMPRLLERMDEVDAKMRALQNPPDEFKASYDALMDAYLAAKKLSRMATDPSGSLMSYRADANATISEFVRAYERLQALLPELDLITM